MNRSPSDLAMAAAGIILALVAMFHDHDWHTGAILILLSYTLLDREA